MLKKIGSAGSPQLLAKAPSEQLPSNRADRDVSCPNSRDEAATMSAATSPMNMIVPPTSKRLRWELFNKLGIVNQQDTTSSKSSLLLSSRSTNSRPPQKSRAKRSTSRQPHTKSILGHAATKITKAPLKGISSEEEAPQNSSSKALFDLKFLGALGLPVFQVGAPASATDDDTSSLSSSARYSIGSTSLSRRRLSFDEEVAIVTIPRREQYSNRMQEQLWHNKEDLEASIRRNTVEYAADGWIWQQVREEDDHLFVAGGNGVRDDGEYIHPVHGEIARLIRREQGLPDNVPVSTPFLQGMTL